jgi:predicted anti-sigma-YlaC factor YlaD
VNDCRFDHGTKYFLIINALLLIVTFGNESSFEPINRTISITFEFKDSFTTNNILSRRRRNKNSSVVFGEVHSIQYPWHLSIEIFCLLG